MINNAVIYPLILHLTSLIGPYLRFFVYHMYIIDIANITKTLECA